MAESSEEKSQPGSQKKIRDARQKGQAAKSQDMVTAIVMLACTMCVAAYAAWVESAVRGLLDLTARLSTAPFHLAWPQIGARAVELVMGVTVPLLFVTVAVVALSNIAIMRGVLFSGEPVKPEFERIDPVSGVKRIFSMRSVIEFLKALFKVIALAFAFLVVYRQSLQMLMSSSTCGFECVEAAFFVLLKPLLITALIAFLLTGAADIALQRWLFNRDMRMTKSEQKREQKNMEGDPGIRRERQRQRRVQSQASPHGLQHASIVIGDVGGWVIGLRYVRGKTRVPMVVFRAPPAQSADAIARSAAVGLPRSTDAALAANIARAATLGDPVPDRYFQAVADLLVASRVIG